ncbi:MAG: hypothetical protein UH542_00895 [Bacteroidales bacterium]|nr:hypothetical protein [Bacteroidales bacterium]
MRKMNKEQRTQIELEIAKIMQNAVSSEYSTYILEQENDTTGNTLMEDIVQNVMETSAWEDEGYYNEDDIRLSIGRELMTRLSVEI